MSANADQGLLDAVLEIGARRANTLREIKRLFESGQESEAVKLTKDFLSVKQEETSRVIRASFPRPAPAKGKQ